MENSQTQQRNTAIVWGVVILIIIIIGGVVYANRAKVFDGDGVATTTPPTATSTVATTTVTTQKPVTSVQIALLKPANINSQTDLKVCDAIVMKTVTVVKTQAPLNAALVALFQRKDPWPPTAGNAGNFITSQKNITFDKVTIVNGTAKVYLTGHFGPFADNCDYARVGNQLTETAKQFSTVSGIEIYLNGSQLQGDDHIPYLSTITPAQGPVGTVVTLSGKNLAGFEGDLDAWIENSKGEVAYLPAFGTVYPQTNQITVKIEAKECKQNNSYSGNPCTSFMTITPGTYKIFTSPWGVTSNSLTFVVTK